MSVATETTIQVRESPGTVRFTGMPRGATSSLRWVAPRNVRIRSVFGHGVKLEELQVGMYIVMGAKVGMDQIWSQAPDVFANQAIVIHCRRDEDDALSTTGPFVVVEYDDDVRSFGTVGG